MNDVGALSWLHVSWRPPSVPVAARVLVNQPRRVAAAGLGVGLALMLILVLQGLSAGLDQRIGIYARSAGADLYVAQAGTTSLLGSTSILDRGVLEEVRSTAGVQWADPVRSMFSVAAIDDVLVPLYVVGSEPEGHGGAWDIVEGHAPRAGGDLVVGEQLAQRHGVQLGDSLSLVGRTFEIVGIARDADVFLFSFAFMTHQASDLLVASEATTSFVLVGAEDPTAVAAELRHGGLHVLTPEELARNDLALKGEAYNAAIGLLLAVAFAVGVLVVALTVYGSVTEQVRDLGVLKALGASRARLYRYVLAHALVLSCAGLVASGALFVIVVRTLAVLRPQFSVVVTGVAVAQVVLAAVVMALLAAWVPARRVAALAPSGAFGAAR